MKRPEHRRTAPRPPAPETPPESRGRLILLGLLLLLPTLITYLPSLRCGFIWDDDTFLTDNPLIKASDGLARFWTTTQAPDYWPVSSSTLWAEWRLWGMHAAGYHGTNLLLHGLEVLLLWGILRRLRVPGAWLGALLFAVHPVNVESVAWITQRKNLMAMLFSELSVLCFLSYERQDEARRSGGCREGLGLQGGVGRAVGSRRSNGAGKGGLDGAKFGVDPLRGPGVLAYLAGLVCYALALLSKGSVAVLPAIVVGIIAWRRRVELGDILRLVPHAVLTIVFTAVNIWFQHLHNADGFSRPDGPLQRLLGAGAVVWFYLGKALFPAPLVFIYPLWRIRAEEVLWWIPLAGAAALTLVFWRWRSTWGRPFLFGWLYFGAALVPVMGFTDVHFMQYSLVADHYQHLALIAVCAGAAAAWMSWVGRVGPAGRSAAMGVAIGVVCVLAGLSWRQEGLYRDEETLYRRTLLQNPGCWMAYNNLASLVAKEPGRMEEAIADYEAALRCHPAYAMGHTNLGTALMQIPGRMGEAMAHFHAALALQPNLAEAHYDLGLALTRLPGRLPEALDEFRTALRINPDFAEAHNNLGNVLADAGQLDAALGEFAKALRLKPDFAEAYNNLGNALVRKESYAEAEHAFREALRLRPDYAEGYNDLGLALARAGRLSEAVDAFQSAASLRPDYVEAHANRGIVLSMLPGRQTEALHEIQEALRLNPDFEPARHKLEELQLYDNSSKHLY